MKSLRNDALNNAGSIISGHRAEREALEQGKNPALDGVVARAGGLLYMSGALCSVCASRQNIL